jgi:hypothetical protein
MKPKYSTKLDLRRIKAGTPLALNRKLVQKSRQDEVLQFEKVRQHKKHFSSQNAYEMKFNSKTNSPPQAYMDRSINESSRSASLLPINLKRTEHQHKRSELDVRDICNEIGKQRHDQRISSF